jgi:calcineurin-like phosphoesterase family protein
LFVELRIRPGKNIVGSIPKELIERGIVRRGKVHKVPHLSLYGGAEVPFTRHNEFRQRVVEVCKKYGPLQYTVFGWDEKNGKEGRAIAWRVVPSPELIKFRNELSAALWGDFPSGKPYDRPDQRPWFHIAVAYELPPDEAERVSRYLRERDRSLSAVGRHTHYVPYIPLDGLRVTLLGDGNRIDREFDLVQRRTLTRAHALNRHIWYKSLAKFREEAGMQLQSSLVSKIKGVFRRRAGQGKYFISDLHFDHKNIIKLCARPFSSLADMNRILLQNWNSTVGSKDEVYFAGDLAYIDRFSPPPTRQRLDMLKGIVHFIKGNHDNPSQTMDYQDSATLIVDDHGKKRSFVVVHDPEEIPSETKQWSRSNDAWTIHGDAHNNRIDRYPFINGEKKTINVSAELVGYKPVGLDFLLSPKLNIDTIRRMDTFRSTPVRK